MIGVFYGVGVGPGDPELLTLKAVNVIREADVIIAPKTEKKEDSTALSIARPYLQDNVTVLELVFPMVNDTLILTEAWEYNKNAILDLLKEGKKVVFLTLGDPMFYSTYIYVFNLLKDCGYPVETVPGITAFCAIGSKMGYPLVEGNNVLSVVPCTIEEERLDEVLKTSDNLVLMKVYKNYTQILEKLEKYGLMENAIMVSKCGLEDETVVHDLKDAGLQKVNYLSTILTRRYK
jgi:precorrin-2/cobalt-factor-2 C20-methyltransferase